MPSRFASLVALSLLAAVAVPDAAPARRAGASAPRIVSVTVANAVVKVRGRVRVTGDSDRVRVRLALVGADGRRERFRAARVTRRGTFTARRTTAQNGKLTLIATTTVGGRRVGRRVTRAVEVAARLPAGVLQGTLRLDPGAAASRRTPTGSWFQMRSPRNAIVQNFSSPASNKDFTPLTPGTDGGLRTDVFQGPPTPAFSGGDSGDARADRIIRPVPFFNTNFSIVTAATDPQLGVADPLPAIRQEDGKLTGQLSAWVAQWNGQSFNQGTPKPDGTTPGTTTPLTGRFDVQTGRFELDWRSLIVGGPFNGFTGIWHLEGTYAPGA